MTQTPMRGFPPVQPAPKPMPMPAPKDLPMKRMPPTKKQGGR